MIACICNNISLEVIHEELRRISDSTTESETSDIAKLQERIPVSTKCGRCREFIQQSIDDYRSAEGRGDILE